MSDRERVHCPTCGLTLTPRSPILLPRHCPRCVVRRRILVELELRPIEDQPLARGILAASAGPPIAPQVGGRA
jgi:hypothetical protein